MGIAIVDYGMANLRSVQKAFEQAGHRAEIVATPEEIERADKVVLPGVGAFKDAILTLRRSGLAEPILRHIEKDRPFLGICLGFQMLFDVGHEDGEHRGLGVLNGACVRFDVDASKGLKVPHMGWNQLQIVDGDSSPVLKGLSSGCHAYFVHSYHCVAEDRSVIATTTDYGGPFVSSVRRSNLFATQFHPEKSQKVGLQMLANFAAA